MDGSRFGSGSSRGVAQVAALPLINQFILHLVHAQPPWPLLSANQSATNSARGSARLPWPRVAAAGWRRSAADLNPSPSAVPASPARPIHLLHHHRAAAALWREPPPPAMSIAAVQRLRQGQRCQQQLLSLLQWHQQQSQAAAGAQAARGFADQPAVQFAKERKAFEQSLAQLRKQWAAERQEREAAKAAAAEAARCAAAAAGVQLGPCTLHAAGRRGRGDAQAERAASTLHYRRHACGRRALL